MSPLIKVCGMTEAENIRNVELQGVDMIGFIFYPKSPRCLCQMPGYLPACAKRVGVFVNESKENILMYTDRFGLDYIQLGIQTGLMAAKVLTGEAACEDLPYETIENYGLYINSDAAAELGITIPDDIAQEAQECAE